MAVIIGTCGLVVLCLGLAISYEGLVIAGLIVSVFFLVGAFVTGVIMGVRGGPLVRRFDAYRGLNRPPHPGEHLRGHVPYDADEHLAALLYYSTIPIFGGRVMYRASGPEHWKKLRELVHSKALALPRTLADERFECGLTEIRLTPDLLEPEPIVVSDAVSGLAKAVFGSIYMALAIAMLASGQWVGGGAQLFVGLMWVGRVPIVRRITRELNWEHGAPVAGCGVLRIGKKSRFTCNDAVMIVEMGRVAGGVLVSLLGEAGIARLGFSSISDPDFINLWQRWNHLDPKPELLE
jgi:hypothetical protein